MVTKHIDLPLCRAKFFLVTLTLSSSKKDPKLPLVPMEWGALSIGRLEEWALPWACPPAHISSREFLG